MLIVTRYTWKTFLTKEEIGEILTTYADLGAPPGQVENYVTADLSGGFSILDITPEQLPELYVWRLKMARFMALEDYPVLPVTDAVVQASSVAFPGQT